MGEADASKSIDSRTRGAAPESLSAYALWPRRGLSRLEFDPPLEQEFRQAFHGEYLPQLRRNLWLALGFVIGLSLLTHFILPPAISRIMDLLRLVTFVPLFGIALACVHLPRFHRIYPAVLLMIAPLFGAGVAVLAVIATVHGVSLISAVVIATIYIYILLGMLLNAALAASMLVALCYAVAANLGGMPLPQMLIDMGMLAFTNVIGAMVCYTLERANRTHFLEERLLIETASRDGLTGIHNRRVFDEHLERIWPQAARDHVPLSLILIDIDHFKAYNDSYGHQAGDECLKRVARCLTKSSRRPLDITTRIGGEEFAVVLYDARREHVEEAARGIQAEMERLAIEHLASPAAIKRLTVSIGAASVQPDAKRTHRGFIQLADEALYAAKTRGRNCVVIMDKEYEQLITGSFRKPSGSSAVSPPAIAVNK